MKKIIPLILSLVLAACSAVGSEFDRNRTTWKNSGIAHYRFGLTLGCFCPFQDKMPLSIEVNQGEIVSIAGPDGKEISKDDVNYQLFADYGTIDRIFEKLDGAMDDKQAGDIIVKYDPTFGIPTEASIDYIKLAMDDEIYVTVSGFEKLP